MIQTRTTPRITVVGAGLAGSLLAVFLARRGWRVAVYERRPDPRAASFTGGRSINLALSRRGIHALEQVGLAERVLAGGIPMPGRMIHAVDGTLTYQPYSRHADRAINSVSRGGLNLTLIEAADALPEVELHFDHRCTAVDLDAPAVLFEVPGGGEVRVESDLVIGADGAYSAVRGELQRSDRFDFEQRYLEHGYKELTIPAAPGGGFALDENALHIWPRGGAMMIALPNRDRSFTCTLFWPFAGDHGFDALRGDEDVAAHFRDQYGDAVPLMPGLLEDFRRNPVSSLVTIRCRPWHRGRVLLIGDAAHAIVPFFGQGMNAAFEDCTVLDRHLDEHGADWDRVLESFWRERKPDADAIADLAMDNFIEMRDRVGSRVFLLRKRLEKLLDRVSGYVPLYDMVTFSLIPYAEARRRARRQDLVVAGAGALVLVVVLFALIALLAALTWSNP